ncbi:unnamed protein product [Cercopithifilaria johnstoni]|uniref:Uncharacterized protein n=1 Tax=Cercopithifilaria johnstoni TaxID=2874296 RepID=A0A8J2MLE9_9BILA|nr:unnamed protein product [Cercopithifilaria johnstoni]
MVRNLRMTNLTTQLATISMHAETAKPVKLDDKLMLSLRMYKSYPSSGILPIHSSDFIRNIVNNYNGPIILEFVKISSYLRTKPEFRHDFVLKTCGMHRQ